MAAKPRKLTLKLYITGHTAVSRVATENLKKIMEEDFKGLYDLQVIDVLEHPQ